MDANVVRLYVYTVIGRCAYRYMISSDSLELKVFLNRNSYRGPTAPYADDEIRSEFILENLMRKPERILEQLLGCNIKLVHGESYFVK